MTLESEILNTILLVFDMTHTFLSRTLHSQQGEQCNFLGDNWAPST
jgi:hypothetical protein